MHFGFGKKKGIFKINKELDMISGGQGNRYRIYLNLLSSNSNYTEMWLPLINALKEKKSTIRK